MLNESEELSSCCCPFWFNMCHIDVVAKIILICAENPYLLCRRDIEQFYKAV